MGFRKISRDLKVAAMRMHDQGILPVAAIIDCLQISERTFYRVRELWVTTGDVVCRTHGIHGRPRTLHFDNIDYLRRIIGVAQFPVTPWPRYINVTVTDSSQILRQCNFTLAALFCSLLFVYYTYPFHSKQLYVIRNLIF